MLCSRRTHSALLVGGKALIYVRIGRHCWTIVHSPCFIHFRFVYIPSHIYIPSHVVSISSPRISINSTFGSILSKYLFTIGLNSDIPSPLSILNEVDRVGNRISLILFPLLHRLTILYPMLKGLPLPLMLCWLMLNLLIVLHLIL